MFTCTLRKSWLTLIAALGALALTIDSASAQRGGDGSRAGSAGIRAGFTGSEAVRAAPTLQATPMRLPQLSTGATSAVAPTGSLRSAVSTAPKSADPRASGAAAAAALLLNSTQSASPTSAQSTPAPTPMSAVAAPQGRLEPIAPLSPPIATTDLGTGRVPATSTAVSPYFSSSAPVSRSEAAPSLAGGGGGTLEDCMGFWDRATHMTKNEWRAACRRTLHRLDDVEREFARKPTPAKPSQ